MKCPVCGMEMIIISELKEYKIIERSDGNLTVKKIYNEEVKR